MMTTTQETVDEYLAKHHVLTYLQDAIEQLLDYKDENPKVVTNRFFFDYFTRIKEGNHVLFRDYQFIQATPHNRASFLNLFFRCFRHIGKRGDLLTVAEYNSLIRLLCVDFPISMVQKTAYVILMEDATDSLVSFSDFIYAFQIQFYYEEFLVKCYETYQTLVTSPPHDTVVVPTSETPATDGDQRESSPADTVDSTHLYKLICPMIEKATFSCPSMTCMYKLLSQAPNMSYYSLLTAMAKSDEINEELGVLPCRDDLYEGVEEQAMDFSQLSKASLENPSSTSISTVNVSETTSSETPADTKNQKDGNKKSADKAKTTAAPPPATAVVTPAVPAVKRVVKKKVIQAPTPPSEQKSSSDDDDDSETSDSSDN